MSESMKYDISGKNLLNLQPYHMITNPKAKQDEAGLIFVWVNHPGHVRRQAYLKF